MGKSNFFTEILKNPQLDPFFTCDQYINKDDRFIFSFEVNKTYKSTTTSLNGIFTNGKKIVDLSSNIFPLPKDFNLYIGFENINEYMTKFFDDPLGCYMDMLDVVAFSSESCKRIIMDFAGIDDIFSVEASKSVFLFDHIIRKVDLKNFKRKVIIVNAPISILRSLLQRAQEHIDNIQNRGFQEKLKYWNEVRIELPYRPGVFYYCKNPQKQKKQKMETIEYTGAFIIMDEDFTGVKQK